jgi:2'-5' RNA ligase
MERLAGRGVSLWLVPDGEERALLAGLIARLSSRLGTPSFEPHVTLLPGLTRPADEVVEASRALATAIETMVLALRPPEGREEGFRCLYLPVGETFRLLRAHALARAAFPPAEEGPFEPHLSLVYGRLAPDRKEQLLREIPPSLPPRVELAALEVVRTEGPVEAWRRLVHCPLSRPAVGQDRKNK